MYFSVQYTEFEKHTCCYMTICMKRRWRRSKVTEARSGDLGGDVNAERRRRQGGWRMGWGAPWEAGAVPACPRTDHATGQRPRRREGLFSRCAWAGRTACRRRRRISDSRTVVQVPREIHSAEGRGRLVQRAQLRLVTTPKIQSAACGRRYRRSVRKAIWAPAGRAASSGPSVAVPPSATLWAGTRTHTLGEKKTGPCVRARASREPQPTRSWPRGRTSWRRVGGTPPGGVLDVARTRVWRGVGPGVHLDGPGCAAKCAKWARAQGRMYVRERGRAARQVRAALCGGKTQRAGASRRGGPGGLSRKVCRGGRREQARRACQGPFARSQMVWRGNCRADEGGGTLARSERRRCQRVCIDGGRVEVGEATAEEASTSEEALR